MTNPLKEPASIEDLLLFRISRILSMGGAPVIRLCEGQYGITRREWRIVGLLSETEGILSSDLAVRAQLDRARTSRAVTGLVAKKLVSRTPRPGDRRAATLALTPAGPVVLEGNVWCDAGDNAFCETRSFIERSLAIG